MVRLPDMKAGGLCPKRDRLNRLLLIPFVTALVLGVWRPAAAWEGEPISTETAISDIDSPSQLNTPGSSVSSTVEVPTRKVPDRNANDTEHPIAAPPTPLCASCDVDPDTPVGDVQSPNGVVSYEAQRSGFDSEEIESSWIGLSLSKTRRKLSSGGYANGLLIVDVQPQSPAARAGLQPSTEGKARTAVEVAAMAAGMMFPPAMLGVAIIRSTHVDESYDMIIGIDGDRVANFDDFEAHLRIVEPGETVYLNIVRNGARLQVPVSIPNMNSRDQCGSLPCLPAE
jgi:PDZ domain